MGTPLSLHAASGRDWLLVPHGRSLPRATHCGSSGWTGRRCPKLNRLLPLPRIRLSSALPQHRSQQRTGARLENLRGGSCPDPRQRPHADEGRGRSVCCTPDRSSPSSAHPHQGALGLDRPWSPTAAVTRSPCHGVRSGGRLLGVRDVLIRPVTQMRYVRRTR